MGGTFVISFSSISANDILVAAIFGAPFEGLGSRGLIGSGRQLLSRRKSSWGVRRFRAESPIECQTVD